MRTLLVFASVILFQPGPASAFERLEGYFIAEKACEAFQSKNKQTNPGNIATSIRVAYDMIGINKAGGDYFQIRIEDAPVTTARWVSSDCGIHVVSAGTATAEPLGNDQISDLPGREESTDNLLTLSWQPAFCEIRPGKTECQDLNAGNLPHTTRQLSIHGLWPQPKGNNYCGVSRQVRNLDKPNSWHLLPAPDLDTDTTDALAAAMPGFASHLHHHEWIKHGTCYFGEGKADEYYDDTLYLTELVNDSAVADLFVNNVGSEITGDAIRTAFDQSFGEGTGDRVLVKCTNDDGRTLVNEIWISLKGQITPESDLGDLMLAANATQMGCNGGLVDPAGLQ
ncbi:ribonuclease T [Roseibium denhamense]|uniref:Ribonuclease T2 n=1 Tax=Roseibium denhamense TaxID=76305 RepID=A0ABY1NFB3_9HYPH|nr:ribonuclease T [Roseibium denhamense]MTI06318.1 ribonuclease T [Roseibium denhamense]SMP08211.1 ribonuclease T2 [Roseibium denhamense]